MISILIVDDSLPRVDKLKLALSDLVQTSKIKIDVKLTSDSAIIALRLNRYDYLVLDVFLPKKNGYSPDEKNGLELLKKISNDSNILAPKKIVGITAYLKDISRYESEFRNYASVIFEARPNDRTWLDSLSNIIKKDVITEVASFLSEKNNTLITVHGIRTFAPWQSNIEDKISNITNNYNFIRFNYGYLNLFCFIFPFFRKKFSKKLINDIKNAITSNKNNRIYIICHSFGTYLTYSAITKITDPEVKIECLIMSGSVLKRTTPLNLIKDKCFKIINDCAVDDYILLLCKTLVVGLGDAGRKGFIEANDAIFINRYFNGGHSMYFENEKFIDAYWMPTIFNDKLVVLNDDRKNHLFSDLTNSIQNLLELFKPLLWLFIILALLFIIFKG